jgi:RNA polymerase sigma factor (TIGR02999 family)
LQVENAVMTDVTHLLEAIEQGNQHASEELLPLVYQELRRLAAHHLSQEKPGQTLEATALVHEAYLRLVGPAGTSRWDGRGHFFAAAAEAMRRILVESARRKQAAKRGGERNRAEMPIDLPAPRQELDVLAVHEVLDLFAAEEPQTAELVKLHFFAGLPLEEAAAVLGLSARTAYRNWGYAGAWLFQRLKGNDSQFEENSPSRGST